MSGLNAFYWVLAVGMAVLIAVFIVKTIQAFRNRVECEYGWFQRLYLRFYALEENVNKLKKDVDELKQKQQ